MARPTAFLDVHKGISITIPEAELGSGKTLTAKWSESKGGNPTGLTAIGTPKTATAASSAYTITYTPSDLNTDLASYTDRVVYLHLYDSVVWRDCYAYRITQTDEDVNTGTP
jgi:hypothetical protein